MYKECMFQTMTEEELQITEAGGLFLGILSGLATVVATIAVAVVAPPGTKLVASFKMAVGGIVLTAAAYNLDTI